MYLYYNGFFKKFKKVITIIQILQHFIFLIGLYIQYFIFKCYIVNEMLKYKRFVSFFCIAGYFVLFLNFFISSYLKINTNKND